MSEMSENTTKSSSFVVANKVGYNNKIQQLEDGLITPIQFNGLLTETYSLQERMEKYHVPGVSIALIENGKIAWSKSWGSCTADCLQAVNTETLFQAASMSKPIAAVAALRMVDQGELALDKPINPQLTRWQIPDNEFTQQQPVTLRHLLCHTAGTTVHGFAG